MFKAHLSLSFLTSRESMSPYIFIPLHPLNFVMYLDPWIKELSHIISLVTLSKSLFLGFKLAMNKINLCDHECLEVLFSRDHFLLVFNVEIVLYNFSFDNASYKIVN